LTGRLKPEDLTMPTREEIAAHLALKQKKGTVQLFFLSFSRSLDFLVVLDHFKKLFGVTMDTM
jgi:hypothetical protein